MILTELKNISLRFRQAHRATLQNISFSINEGDFIILLGSNGSGKSSLLKVLHGEHIPNTGKILFEKTKENTPASVKVLTQDCDKSLFSSLTVYENYLLTQTLGMHRVRDKDEREHLAAIVTKANPNLANKLDTPVHLLSGGEKQALALAFCFLNPPTLLLLDEHTSALDPKTSKQIMTLTQKMLDAYKITCVLTTHDLELALRYGNRIIILKEGKIHKQYNALEKAKLVKEELLLNYE